MFPYRMFSLSEMSESTGWDPEGYEPQMPDDDTKSILLSLLDEDAQHVSTNGYMIAKPVLLTTVGVPSTIASRKECLETLDKAFDHMGFEKELTVKYRVCGACSAQLKGPLCTHCRCHQCTAWKTKCACYMRAQNRRNIFAWMKRGYYQYFKAQNAAPTFQCVLCSAPLTSLTAPYLRCLGCIAKTI